ncbi:MAG: M56 family metallopeptidase [Bacteroidota bacterium]
MLSHFPVISDTLIAALGWTIVHSIWQIALIGSIYFIADRWQAKASASRRYVMAIAALVLIVVSTIGTFCWFFEGQQPPLTDVQMTTDNIVYSYTTDVLVAEETSFSLARLWLDLESYFPLLTNMWMLGVGLLLCRLLWNYAAIWRLRRFGKFDVDVDWQQRFEALSRRMVSSRVVQLFESSLVQVPLTIGHLKPLILLPIGTINQLTTAEVEAILIHELAHIARHDFLVNFFQSFVEIVLFYHPVVWWISAHIRREREHCCDDRTLAMGVDRLTYAKALYQLQKQTVAPILALSFAAKRKQLLHRIQRLLGQPTTAVSGVQHRWWLTIFAMAIFMVGSVKGDSSDADLIVEEIPESTVSTLIPTLDNKTFTGIKETKQAPQTQIESELSTTQTLDDAPLSTAPPNVVESFPGTTAFADWEEEIEMIDAVISSAKTKPAPSDFMKELRRQLLQDALIKDIENYTLDWTHRRLKVNGQLQSAVLQKRYQQLIEKHRKAPLTKKDKVRINVRPDLQEIFFDFKENGGIFRNESLLPNRLLEQLYTAEKVVAEADDEDLISLQRSKVIRKIDKELRKDGIVKKKWKYTFELNARTRQLLIDGMEQPLNWQRKYERMLRASTTYDLSWDFVFGYTKSELSIQQSSLSNYSKNPHRTYGKAAAQQPDYIFDNGVLLTQLNRLLRRDKLLDHTKSYTFKIDDNRLSINDIPQDAEWQWKYEQFIRDQAAVPLADTFHFTLEHNIDGETNFILTDN